MLSLTLDLFSGHSDIEEDEGNIQPGNGCGVRDLEWGFRSHSLPAWLRPLALVHPSILTSLTLQ